jgi:NAD+ diphosphatase
MERQYLGELQEKPCYAVEVAAPGELPPDLEFSELRPLYGRLESDLFQAAGCALQVLGWDRTHQFCGRCGAPTAPGIQERFKQCPSCGLVNYPRISPAIIVAVTKGPRLLLARANRFQNNMYSVLAGYAEFGETLEDCVRREVREEVGLALKNIRYFGSQPWPFSNALMVAFTAEHAGGEIAIDGVEISDAGWFTADALPRIPEKLSIARRLIDWFVEHHQ